MAWITWRTRSGLRWTLASFSASLRRGSVIAKGLSRASPPEMLNRDKPTRNQFLGNSLTHGAVSRGAKMGIVTQAPRKPRLQLRSCLPAQVPVLFTNILQQLSKQRRTAREARLTQRELG